MARNIHTNLILLEIAEGLKEIIKNPNLEQAIKDAYSLSEAEKTAAEDARAIIDSAAEQLADIEKKKAELAVIDDRIAEANKLELFNENTLKDIAKKNAALLARENIIAKAGQDQEKRTKSIDEKEKALDSREALIFGKNAELIEYEARLNRAAAISQEALKAI